MNTVDAEDAMEIIARQLPRAGVSFLLIGGHAVNHYGYTRATLDIDFMIATDAAPTVRRILTEAGFTNVAEHKTVLFFSKPDSSLRIDFLRVDSDTMQTLLKNATEIEYFGRPCIKVPQLRDLLAMKFHALAHGSVARRDRDLPDIVTLALLHHYDPDIDLKPLCDRYGSPEIFSLVKERMEARRHA